MAISTFAPHSGDDFINLSGFPGFPGFAPHAQMGMPHQQLGLSPPSTSEGSPDSSAAHGDPARFRQLSNSSAAPTFADDDEDNSDDDGDDLDGGKRRSGNANSKRGKASSAERRATHNAIERARRESLNGRFMELAQALPTMASVKRPSKSVIVNKSLEWIYDSQVRERALVNENNMLRAELNDLRAKMSLPALAPPAPLPLASDYARFKHQAGPLSAPAMGIHAYGAQAQHYHHQIPTENYFGVGAANHPNQFNGFQHGNGGAALPNANMLGFNNAFQFAPGTGHQNRQSSPTGPVQQTASPTAKSDSSDSGSLGGSSVQADDATTAAQHKFNFAEFAAANGVASLWGNGTSYMF